MFNLLKGNEAVHRFGLWFAIGFLISFIGHYNESIEQQLFVVKRITETTVQQWNIVGIIGIILLIFTFVLYILKSKYEKYLNDIFVFFRNSTAYTLVPTFSTASLLLGTMTFYLLFNATKTKEYLFSFWLIFIFFIITVFIWLIHAFIQEDKLINNFIIKRKKDKSKKILSTRHYLKATTIMKYIIIYTLSPTLALADRLKSTFDKTTTVKNLNSIYLGIAVVSSVLLTILNATREALINNVGLISLILWCYFLMSRNNEVFIAFLKDAFDKLKNPTDNNTNLLISDRISLSLKSYLELIINFAIVYFLLPIEFWKKDGAPNDIESSLYFSGVTITTLGYGDITPIHWFPQLLTVYEVFCGFILLIVCFAIYTNINNHK